MLGLSGFAMNRSTKKLSKEIYTKAKIMNNKIAT